MEDVVLLASLRSSDLHSVMAHSVSQQCKNFFLPEKGGSEPQMIEEESKSSSLPQVLLVIENCFELQAIKGFFDSFRLATDQVYSGEEAFEMVKARLESDSHMMY